METLLTTKDIAKLAGCRPVTVRSWRAKHGDFPRPAAVYGDTPVFRPDEIMRWLLQRGKVAA